MEAFEEIHGFLLARETTVDERVKLAPNLWDDENGRESRIRYLEPFGLLRGELTENLAGQVRRLVSSEELAEEARALHLETDTAIGIALEAGGAAARQMSSAFSVADDALGSSQQAISVAQRALSMI